MAIIMMIIFKFLHVGTDKFFKPKDFPISHLPNVTCLCFWKFSSVYKMTICGDSTDSPNCLCVQHFPALPFEFMVESISKVTVSYLGIFKSLKVMSE